MLPLNKQHLQIFYNKHAGVVAKWSGIVAIVIILIYVFKTTILKLISSVKGFIKRNTPSFNFLYV